jgi:hypothetical protein
MLFILSLVTILFLIKIGMPWRGPLTVPLERSVSRVAAMDKASEFRPAACARVVDLLDSFYIDTNKIDAGEEIGFRSSNQVFCRCFN